MFGSMFAARPFSSEYSDVTYTCGPYGKQATLGEMEDVIRRESGRVNDERYSSPVILKLINHACAEVARKNGLQYICYRNLGIGTSFDLSGIGVVGVHKVVDSLSGEADYNTPEDFERDIPGLYADSVNYTLEGEMLRVAYGSDLTPGLVKLFYYRKPIYGTARTDYPDIPDRFTGIVVNMVLEGLI